MNAEIISIGTEIILGDILNTNTQYLSQELANVGIDVHYHVSVGDNKVRLLEVIKESLKRSDLIITTGGLGPTDDDLTKEVVAKYFEEELVLNVESLRKIKSYYSGQQRTMPKSNEKQAYFCKDSIILDNSCGTAPGNIIERGEKIIIILPGPPNEMKAMFNNYVKPYLLNKSDEVIYSKTLRIFGIGESTMEELVQDIIINNSNPTIAPYAKELDVILRITAKGKSQEACRDLIKPIEYSIRQRLGIKVYGENNDSLDSVLGKLLCDNNLTISVAESCTGGMVSGKLISYPGISNVFLEGMVTYSNSAKIRRLGVKEATLKDFGAVSKETAKEMAIGVARESGSDISIATTGIAGPGGGTNDKPVGLVYIGVYIKGDVIVKKFIFNGDRERVRVKATMNALNILREELINRGYK